MSTSGALYTSASLKAANAPPYVFSDVLSLETCLGSTYSLDVLQGSLYPLRQAILTSESSFSYSVMDGKLDPMLLQALKDMKFDFMTPVQSQVLAGMPSLKSDW